MKKSVAVALVLVSGSLTGTAWASTDGSVLLPNTFTAGTPALAEQVNANFAALQNAANASNSRLTTAEVNLDSKQNRVSGACASGYAIQAINADGSVLCQPDTSLTMSGTTLSVNTAGGVQNFDLAERLTIADLGDARGDATSLYLGTGAGAGASGGSYNIGSGRNALFNNTTGNNNTASGVDALAFNITGNGNTASGYRALYSNSTGSFNTALGYFADVSSGALSNATAIGYNAKVDASNKMRIGNTAVAVIEGQVPWSSPSDIRIKKDVEEIGFGLSFINSLRPVQYRLKEGNERTDFGFIAQEVEATLGDGYNVLGIGQDAERSLSLRYTDFIAPMVKAIQEQQVIIDDLKSDNAVQQGQVDRLQAQNDALKILVCQDHPAATICQ